MRGKIRLCSVGVVSLLMVTSVSAAVSPDLVGMWLRSMAGTSGQNHTLRMDIASDGTFRLWVDDGLEMRESGEIATAADGSPTYHFDFDNGSKDDGKYEVLPQHAEMHFTNATGTSVYRRAVAWLDAPPAGMPLLLKREGPSWRDLIKQRSATAERLWKQRAAALPVVQIEQASELVDSGQGREAMGIVERVVGGWSRDAACEELGGQICLSTGDAMVARRNFNCALMQRPDWVEAYLGRAMAAGEVGRLPRMRADLQIAHALNAEATDRFKQQHQKEFNSFEAAQPHDAPGILRDRLIKAAAGGAKTDDLLPVAMDLVKAENAVRVVPEERYLDGLRLCAMAVGVHPNDAQAWADFATYLYDESADKFGHGHSDDIEWIADRITAMRFADQALQLDDRNLTALATKAWLLEQDNQEKDSLELARRGLALAPGFPRFAKLESILLSASSLRASNEAARARAPKIWSVAGPNWVTVYTRGPNAQELEAAKNFDAMAAGNVTEGNAAEYGAWERYKDSIAEMNTAAGFYDWIGQNDKAIQLWQRVLTLDPRNTTALYDLEDIYKDAGRNEDAFEMRLRLDNIYATSAAALTEKVTTELVAHDVEKANQDLARALQIDPTDTLVYALLGRAAMMSGDEKAWWRYARCGEAIAVAEGKLHGMDLSVRATAALRRDPVQGVLQIWNSEMKVATQNNQNDEAEHYRQLIDALNRRLPDQVQAQNRNPQRNRTPVPPKFSDADFTVLVNNNEMDAGARACLSEEGASGAWHEDTMGAMVDAQYPIYLYLQPRRNHYELWRYFGAATLQTYEYYARRHKGFDANDPPSRMNHPNAAE